MNSWNGTGRLIKDPELRKTKNDKDVVYFDLAVDRPFKVKGSPTADFPSFTVYGKNVNYLMKYGKKGMYVEVENANLETYMSDKAKVTILKPTSIKLIFANSNNENAEENKEEENENNDNENEPLF